MSNPPDLFDEFGVGADNTDRQRPATGAMSPAVTHQPAAQREAGADLFDEFDVQPTWEPSAWERTKTHAQYFGSNYTTPGVAARSVRLGGPQFARAEGIEADRETRADAASYLDFLDSAQRDVPLSQMDAPPEGAGAPTVDRWDERADERVTDLQTRGQRRFDENIQDYLDLEDRFESMEGFQEQDTLGGKIRHGGAAVGGALGPQLVDPINFIPGLGPLGRGATATSTFGRSAGVGAGINAALEPAFQGERIKYGMQDTFDWTDAGINVALGGTASGILASAPQAFTQIRNSIRQRREQAGEDPSPPPTAEEILGEAVRGGFITPEQRADLIAQATGLDRPGPMPDATPEQRQARSAVQQELAQALGEDAPVFRRQDVAPDPETGDPTIPADARPMEVPGRGQQATATDIEARRRVQRAVQETGSELSEREIDLAARDVLAAGGDDPAAVARQTVRDYDRRAREGAFRESEYRRFQAHGDGPEGTPQATRPQGRDYQPGGRPFDTREGVMLLEGVQRDRQGRMTGGRPVEAVPDPQTGTQIRQLTEDGPSEMHVRDPASGETRWVRADQLEEHQRPDAPRREQDFRERSTTRPAGIGTELRDPATATDRIQTADQAQRVPDPPRTFVEPGQQVDGEVQRQLGAPPRPRGPGPAGEPPAPPQIDGPRGPQAPPQSGGPARPPGRPVEDAPGQTGAVAPDEPRTGNVQTPQQTRQIEQQRRLEAEQARAAQQDEAPAAPEHGSVAEAEADIRPQPPRSESGQTGPNPGREVDPTRDNILQAVAKMGGLNRQNLVAEGMDPASLTGRAGIVGLGSDRRWWKGPRAKNPGESLDGMRERLVEQGYLRDGATTDDLMRAVERQLAGDDQMSVRGGYDTAGARMADEAADEYTGGRQFDTDFTEPETAGAARTQQTDDADADIPFGDRAQGRTDDPFDLEQPTPDSVRAREEAAERAETEARTRREAEEARMRADSEVDEFELTGSDRAADQGGGRQADLVTEARMAEMRQKRNERNADGDGVPARERETLESVEENIASGSQFYSGIPLDRMASAVGRALKRAFNGGDERAWTSYTADLRRLADSFREGRERRQAAREDGAGTIGAGSRISNTVQATIGDANAQLRVLADRYDSPTIRNLADTLRARAGEAKGLGRSFSERSSTEINKAGRRLKDLSDEVAEARLTSRDNQRAIIEMVENKRPRRGKAGEIANKIEKLYDDMLTYQRKAGVEVNRADDYFSRHLDTRKISGSRKNEQRFTRQAAKAYQEIGYTREQADMAANGLMEKLVMGEPQSAPGQTTIFTHGVPEKNLNPRRFNEAAAKHLSDFRDTDIDRVLSSYTMQAIRRSEIARTSVKTGDGTEVQFGHAWENWPEVERAMRNEGATAEDVGAARNLVATMTGTRNYGSSRAVMNASTALRNWAAMALLDQVALSTAPEFFTPALRASSGNAVADMGRVMNMGRVHMQTAVRKAFNTMVAEPTTGKGIRDQKLEAAYDLSEDLGIIAGDAVSYIMQARFLGDDLSGRGQQKILTSYFKNVGLTQLNDYHRAIATRSAHTFMRRMGKNTLAGGRKENQGAYMLRELGVPKGKERAFSQWMQKAGFDEQMPTGTQLTQIKQRGGQDREFARALETAFIRFADQSVMRPDSTTRPAWASTPLGAVAFSLLNFTWAFHDNVLSRWWRMGTQRGEDSLDAVNRLYMMPGMVAGGMAMYGASLGFNEVRDQLREGVTNPDREPAPQTDGFKAERAAAYAGFTGRADPLLQMIGGVRYQRSVTETALGPAFGSIAGMADVMAYQLEASENTNTAERRMAQEMHHMVLSPLAQAGLALAPDFGLAGVATKAAATVGVRSTRDPFVNAVAGEEDSRVTQRRMSQPREGLVDRYITGGAETPGASGPAGRQLERNLQRDSGGRDLGRDLSR